jgi:hypothetical protein
MENTTVDILIKIFDDHLIATGKPYIDLRTAKNLLSRHDNEDINKIHLKELLENNAIPHAYQTEVKPKLWRIGYSVPDDFRAKRKEYLNEHKSDSGSFFSQPDKDHTNTVAYIVGGISVVVFIIFFLMNLDSEKKSYSQKTNNSTQSLQSESSSQETSLLNHFTIEKFTLKSNLYDLEKNGLTVRTAYETTYHTFDFSNKVVIQKSTLNGEWVTF